jgi:hypothetical protein
MPIYDEAQRSHTESVETALFIVANHPDTDFRLTTHHNAALPPPG